MERFFTISKNYIKSFHVINRKKSMRSSLLVLMIVTLGISFQNVQATPLVTPQNWTPYPYFTTTMSSEKDSSTVCFTGQIIDTTDLRTGDLGTVSAPYPIAVSDLNSNFLEPGQELLISYFSQYDYTWRFMDSVTIVKLDTASLEYDICSAKDSLDYEDNWSMYNRLTYSDYPPFDSLQFIYVPQSLVFQIGDYIKGRNYQAKRSPHQSLVYINENSDTLSHSRNFDVSFRGEFEISDQPIPLHSNPIQQHHTPKFHTITNQQLLLQNPTTSTAKYTLINAQGKTVFQQRLNPGMEESIPMKSAQLLWLRVESEKGVDVSVVRGF